MRQLLKQHEAFLFATLVSLLMSFLMGGVLTAINIGISEAAVHQWLTRAFPVGFLVAWPISLFVIPLVRRFISYILR